MNSMLRVRLTETRHKEPLAMLCNLACLDADMTPAQLRQLAQALLSAADDCEARPIDQHHFTFTEREYPIAASGTGLLRTAFLKCAARKACQPLPDQGN